VIDSLDISDPKKTYNYKGFKISPSHYWVEDFFRSLKKLSQESRKLMFWDQTDNDLYFNLRSFTRTKGFRFEKNGRGMYWLFNEPKDLNTAWTLDVFNPIEEGINGIDFIRAVPTYFYIVDKFAKVFNCKKLRAYVVNDNKQSLRMCQMLVKKGYLEIECELKNEVNILNQDRDLTLFLRSK
jgi:hypothetical protein